MKILIIEDDLELRKELKVLLDYNGYQGIILQNFKDTLEEILEIEPDLILLDIKIPYLNGQQLLKKLREVSTIPVIMVTSKDSEIDEILALSYGADDYITKPYNPTILLLHIEAVFKRLHKNETKLLYHDIKVDLMKSTLKNENQELILSKNEMGIFYFLLMNQGKIVTRDDIMNYLWGTDKFIDDNTLTVNMTRLRKRLEKIGLYNVIETRRDQGYILI
ncbi:DNA-binding response regulator [Thomasclavelia cocleata]|uniref:DNA-binding response regulator, OmpR family, contains REC and winged-helix (WHTH) domain n=2 Tax=Thomasclavelia cocleata TaxID=69824 RepID=A0A1I0HMX0_9FIRM|nr:response regulator transcription factor [Thomasclavelia cocleata]MCI9630956.1 response regulator transcription factor [Thomasclavelia cocleata]MCR1961544.1 response regulator transcription factor [Thomasclavelia cocleata]NDO41159.1 response regulator transcription factor [Thomasclavelia cocleata]PJN81827.1 DNA-binding response regulator [Thomasclavelia cocleata]SET85395.1 DNA-binding response regulator, OmpR family, contains REC and winged-helix (wHTH) domain [Thomasclavelia cocleata]